VTASGGRLPPAYGFQRSSTVVSVPPGRTAAVEFRVMLRSGEAALSEGGALELQAKPPKRP